MKKKTKFEFDYEIKSSTKILYPFLSTASGLSEWYADEVTIEKEIFTFSWNNNDMKKAKIITHKLYKSIKLAFLDEQGKETEDCDYLEFLIEESEITRTTFLKVIDYSDFDDVEELHDVWTNLFEDLKRKIGA